MHHKAFAGLVVTILLLVVALPTAATESNGQAIVVTSAGDSGPGTLRQALLDAQEGDTITFDPATFAPTAPVTITITSALPHIHASYLTVDASNAGVTLDGSGLSGEWEAGLQIVGSEGSTIRGLRIANFSGPGIAISGEARHNTIGGNRSIGTGPFGQGNSLIHNTIGIDLSTPGTTLSVITGNLMGTDADGVAQLGNERSGVWIGEGASGNTIGPDNVIAYNGEVGIGMEGADTHHNTITQNSIHDNHWMGILLRDGANLALEVPLILDFDLQESYVMGVTCANCTIEVFSDEDDEGARYEGQATADDYGIFTLDKEGAFVGPHLTATATDTDGNTSEFSASTSGTGQERTIQIGNDQPVAPFWAQCSSYLEDNEIGTFWGYAQNTEGWGDIACTIQGVKGFKMVRLAFNELEDWPSIDWSVSEFDITPEQDALVTRLAENGITVTYLLNFWDKAKHPEGWPEIPSRFTTEEEILRYQELVRFVVQHFKDRIRYYELWNEPDAGGPIQHIKPQDYVELVRRVAPVIREEYPEAKIVVGSIILHNTYGQYYLDNLIRSDVMPLVDVVAWHPFYFIGPEYEEEWDYYTAYPQMLREIKKTAESHGFQGEFRADEIGWCDPYLETCGAAMHSFTGIVAAKYHTRDVVTQRGEDVTIHLGGMSDRRRETNPAVSNVATLLAGAESEPLPFEIQTSATDVVSYTFSVPYGDRLIALWTEGEAVDVDSGIPIALTIPDTSDCTVTAVDVLHSFEQSLITSEKNGSVTIRDLLVKDYAVILRLRPSRRVYLPIVQKQSAP